MNAKERRQFERLERLLEVERKRAEQAWEGYRVALYENVGLKMKLQAVEEALAGDGQERALK